MIQLKSIILRDFLSHDFTALTLEDGDKVLISGISGAGKSSIIDAIIFCFYGKGRAENNKGLIRLGKKEATVEVRVQNGDLYYSITRTVNIKGKQTLEIGSAEDYTPGTVFAPVASVGLKDAQLWLETQLLKSSYTLFVNSIAYTQDGTDNFVKQTAAKRKELLLEIVNTQDFELYYNRAKSELDSTNEKVTRTTAEIAGFNDTIEFTKGSKEKVAALKAKLDSAEEEKIAIEADIKELRGEKELFTVKTNKIKELEAQIHTGKLYVEDKRKQTADKLAAIEAIRNIDVSQIEKDVEKLHILEENKLKVEEVIEKDREVQSEINKLMFDRPRKNDYSSENKAINDRLVSLMTDKSAFCETIGKDCPKLADKRNEEIKLLEDRANEIAKEIFENKKKEDIFDAKKIILEGKLSGTSITILTSLKAQIDALKSAETELAVAKMRKDRIAELGKECLDIEAMAIDMETKVNSSEELLSKELASFDKTYLYSVINGISEDESLLNKINLEINEMNLMLGSSMNSEKIFLEATGNKVKKEKELEELVIKQRRLTLAKEAFGGKGLKNIVIDYILPRLEGKINMILGKLSDFTVSLDTQKTGADGESIVEGLFINIFNNKGEQLEFNSYSGGEKSKIVYSIFEALSSFQRCNFRLLDESISGLHADHADRFADVMLHLDKKDAQVICISHIDLIKDKFEKQILIVKNNNISQIYDKD